MLTRRGFLLLLGAAAGGAGAGLWLPETGIITLPRAMVLGLSGDCWFCDKATVEVSAVAGILGREARICDECALFCADVIEDERDVGGEVAAARRTPDALDANETRRVDHVLEQLRRPEKDLTAAKARLRNMSVIMANTPSGEVTSEMTAQFRAAADEVATGVARHPELAPPPGGLGLVGSRLCSFCDAESDDAAQLLAGPYAKICDRCVGDAAKLMLTQLRV